jgi:hypothetical protein
MYPAKTRHLSQSLEVTRIFVRIPSRLKLTMGQRNGLRSFMKKTKDKQEYRSTGHTQER